MKTLRRVGQGVDNGEPKIADIVAQSGENAMKPNPFDPVDKVNLTCKHWIILCNWYQNVIAYKTSLTRLHLLWSCIKHANFSTDDNAEIRWKVVNKLRAVDSQTHIGCPLFWRWSKVVLRSSCVSHADWNIFTLNAGSNTKSGLN